MPLLIVCLTGLGKLAKKFPNISSTSIQHLRDFLLIPSPLLSDLLKYNENSRKTNEKFQLAYETLRDVAIQNLCMALESAYAMDTCCIPALVANVSNRLFTIERKCSDAVSNNGDNSHILDTVSNSIAASNIVLILGHIAVYLKNTPKTVDVILPFFQQRFCRVPSHLNILIVEQLGCIGACYCQSPIYEEILRMFASVLKTAETQCPPEQEANQYK